MELLSEQDDDPKLSSVQRLEEKIGSVDYDVWICPACLNSDTDRYVKRFSGFQNCAACKARTFKLDPQEVLVPATTVSAGRARIEGRCVSCNHKTVQNVILPMLPQPSSSSSTSSAAVHLVVAAAAEEVADLGAVPVAAAVLREVGDMVFTFAAAVVCAAIVLWYLLTFNALVKARNAVDQAWSHIEVELTRRLDLIQNLVEVAKGYARYEADTFKQVVALRTQPHLFNDAKSANNVQPELTKTISQIMVLAENYPQLRADQSFLDLQKELAETENRIAERRHTYNQSVNMYLNLVRSVPSNAVAKIQNMPEKSFFDVPDDTVSQPPLVKLS